MGESSEIWIRPSTPPRSTKAPKDVKDLTTPVYCLPSSAVAQNASEALSAYSFATFLIEPTTLCLPLLSVSILIILNFCSVLSRTPRSDR